MEVASFRLEVTPFGGRIHVNGEDVTDRVGIAELRVADGQPSTLTLHHIGEGSIEGEGIVNISNTADDAAEIICGFLESIDPDQLDADALNNADSATNLTAVMLKMLQRYARGEPCPT